MFTVKTSPSTSSRHTDVPGLTVIVGSLGSSTSILTTLDGNPLVGQSTVLSEAYVSLLIWVSSVIFKGVAETSKRSDVAPTISCQRLPVPLFLNCH